MPTRPRGDELQLLRRLRGLTDRLAEEQAPGRLVPLVLDSAVELVGAERGFAVLVGDPGPGRAAELHVAAARNLACEEVDRPEFQVSRSIAHRVAASGKAELITDAQADASTRDIESVKQLELRSVLCVPLRAHGRTLGVLYVDHRFLKGEFDARDLATLEAFAAPAALALEAVRRLAELGERVAIIERLRAELAERYAERSREIDRLHGEALRAPGEAPAPLPELPGLVARSPAMRRTLDLVRRVARADVPVLVLGESGAGKEVVARALHALSPRARGPFVAESCAALADSLLESELFGHERGAFTGAHQARAGLFEAAGGGTLLLDEVGEMTPPLQAKLLRVLQEREVRRVGGDRPLPVDVRVVAATHRDLEALVAAGQFRADLYYRLNVVRVEVPPLRARPEDVPALLDAFLARAGGPALDRRARDLLLVHTWPGNVRELENEVRRLAALAGPGGVAGPELLSPSVGGRPAPAARAPGERPIDGVWRLDDVEREMILRALAAAFGNKAEAARLLGVARTTLVHRMEKVGLPPTGPVNAPPRP